MALELSDSPRDVAAFVLPGTVGIGVGVFLGVLLSQSFLVIAVLAVVGAIAGNAVGYWLVTNE